MTRYKVVLMIGEFRCRSLAVIVGAFATVCACDEDALVQTTDATIPDAAASLPTATVVVGTGLDSFVSVDGLEGVAVIEGPQGGYHIWLSVQCQDIGEHVVIQYGVRDADTGKALTIDGLATVVDLEPAGKWMQATALRAFLTTVIPEFYFGRDVTLWARVDDDDGVFGGGEANTHVLDKVVTFGE